MSKRSSEEAEGAGRGDAKKRPRNLASLAALAALESPELAHAIESSDLGECEEVQSKLETLLNQTQARIAALKEEEMTEGLSYKGGDAVTCTICTNTFQSGGKYSAKCICFEEPKTELCIVCVEPCQSCDSLLCINCGVRCYQCDGRFCEGCVRNCENCGELLLRQGPSRWRKRVLSIQRRSNGRCIL